MTVTLDGQTLLTRSLDEGDEGILSDWVEWASGICVPKGMGYGESQQWLLACFESGTAYSSSNYKYFRDKVATGAEMTFVVNLGGEERVNKTVILLKVSRVYDSPASAEAKYRKFDLTIMEV